MSTYQQIRAAVLEELGQPFVIDAVELEPPRANEVLVELAGVGICHTDLKMARGYHPVSLPAVLGHEGAGVVVDVGANVTSVAPGDQVVISFNSCGACPNCVSGHPAICDHFHQLTFACRRPDDGSSPLRRGDQVVNGYFFSQSSFATHAITTERNLAKVDGVELDLALLGPLGCGVQTGAGTVMRVLRPEPGSSIVIFGVGAVGLSAVMAAVVTGAGAIVAVDRQPGRLALAAELGATHTIDTSNIDPSALSAAVHSCTGRGADHVVETTNVSAICEAAFESLAHGGTYAHVGGGGGSISLDTGALLAGRGVRGVIQGDSIPSEFIPELLELHRSGRFPFNRLITSYPFEDINQAVADMESGATVKPVLRMPG